MEATSEVTVIGLIVKQLCQCLCQGYVVNQGCFGGDSDQIDCETALPVLVLRYVVNGGCFGAETDRFECETASPVLVSRYVVNQVCFGDDTD